MISRPRALPQAFFLAVKGTERFCLFYPAAPGPQKGRVLCLHPFAEELNASRRVMAQQARALSESGHAVLQIDLLGCGDSAGDLSEASWAAWLHDAHAALTWLDAHSSGQLWLWGIRSGALLAAQLLADPRMSCRGDVHLLLWQPVYSGAQMLQQFLRLHAASQWLDAGKASDGPPAKALADGNTVTIAGYALSPALAQDIAQATLTPPAPPAAPGHLAWLEVGAQAWAEPGPAAQRALALWRDAGWRVHAKGVQGARFWQTVDLHDASPLHMATREALEAAPPDDQGTAR